MRKAEQKLWDTMKRNTPKTRWVQRVENLVGEGMPDLFIAPCYWIELKAPKPVKRNATALLGPSKLRPAQIGWHLRAYTHAIDSYILIRVDGGKEIFLLPGRMAAHVNEMTMTEIRSQSAASSWVELWRIF